MLYLALDPTTTNISDLIVIKGDSTQRSGTTKTANALVTTGIDLSTSYTPLNKATTAITPTVLRRNNAKILRSSVSVSSPASASALSLPVETSSSASSGNDINRHNNVYPPKHTLVAISAKSYVSPPSTQQPNKLLKHTVAVNDNHLKNKVCIFSSLFHFITF